MEAARSITVIRKAVDGYQEERTYKTLTAARRWAQDYVGAHPSKTEYYAVSSDGLAVVRVEGATLNEIFPDTDAPADDKLAARKAAKAARARARRARKAQ